MTDKEKQIEEMAKALRECYETEDIYGNNPDFNGTAENLYNAGYGNIKEFAERLKAKSRVIREGNSEWYDNVRVAIIDDLLNELYGESK